MKRKILFVLVFLSTLFYSQNEFVTVWKPSNVSSSIESGTLSASNNNQIWFPGIGNNYQIYWEEVGFPQNHQTLNNVSSTHNFLIDFGIPYNPNPAYATYTLKVTNGNGVFQGVRFASNLNLSNPDLPVFLYYGDVKKIVEISNWGNAVWTTLNHAFADCSNLDITATDIPNFSQVTEARFTFMNCASLIFNTSINNWDTSNVTTMRYMFAHSPLFNQPVGNWDTSNVTDIGWMFHYIQNFNQPLNSWDTSNMVYMDHVFHGCTSFDQDLSNWQTSNVTTMQLMFTGCTSFNQNLGMWNLNSLTDALGMLTMTGLNCNNWDNTLYGWNIQATTPNNINLGNVVPLKYKHPLAIAARDNLLNVKNWTFSGDTLGGECESMMLSISEADANSLISIYPVPANDFIHIKSSEKIKQIKIFDVSGKLVVQKLGNINSIPVSHLEKGTYLISIETASATINRKFIKK